MQPTNELRWLERWEPVLDEKSRLAKKQLVLQQKWTNGCYNTSQFYFGPPLKEEWRDVPVVVEE